MKIIKYFKPNHYIPNAYIGLADNGKLYMALEFEGEHSEIKNFSLFETEVRYGYFPFPDINLMKEISDNLYKYMVFL